MVLWVLAPLAGPLVWAVLLGFLMTPLHRRLSARFNGRRGGAALVLVAAVVFGLALPLGLLGRVLAQQTLELVHALPKLVERAQASEGQLARWSTGAAAFARDVLHIKP